MTKIALIGYGHMGKLMAKNWLNGPDELVVFQKNVQAHPSVLQVSYEDRLSYKDYIFDVVIFAFLPSDAKTFMKDYAFLIHDKTVVVSIMAGISVNTIKIILGDQTPVVRILPNTPVVIGLGILNVYASLDVNVKQKKMVDDLFQPLGTIVPLQDETQMDLFTALTGSGPAYVLYFLEILEQMMKNAQIPNPKDVALMLVKGSVALAEESHDSFEILRKQVASKGGMTEAAMQSLLQSDVFDQFERAVKKATDRAKDLAS